MIMLGSCAVVHLAAAVAAWVGLASPVDWPEGVGRSTCPAAGVEPVADPRDCAPEVLGWYFGEGGRLALTCPAVDGGDAGDLEPALDPAPPVGGRTGRRRRPRGPHLPPFRRWRFCPPESPW